MNSRFFFITKVIVYSFLIACLIKYVAPWLSIPPSNINVLVAICLPSTVLGAIFWWRANQKSQI